MTSNKRKCMERRQRKAEKTRRVRLQNKAERAAMAMLLDAEWNRYNGRFERVERSMNGGFSTYWTYYYDRFGREITAGGELITP